MQHEKLSENLINLKVYLWVNENMRKNKHTEKTGLMSMSWFM